MKKNIWKISALLICIGILINILSFRLKADETYKPLSNGCNGPYYTNWTSGNPQGLLVEIANGNDVRAILARTTNTTTYKYWIVSKNTFKWYYSIGPNPSGCPAAGTSNAASTTIDGQTYYYISSNALQFTHYYDPTTSDIPVYTITPNTLQNAIEIIYADPEPVYGELIIEYSQQIYTEGNGANNEDYIKWNAYMDTNGNDLQGKNIEIQAIAGYFQGSTYADLQRSTFSDWLASTHPAVTMYKGTILKSYEVYNWGNVATNFRNINTLGTWFWNIFTSENIWYQYGWRYQARLLDENYEPLTEWQLIYTGNSYSPSATETLTNDEPLSPDTIETINDINEENGTTNNWYINNTIITNNEYNETYQQNIIENIYNILQGTPDDEINHKADDIQQTIDNAIDTEDDYLNDLQTQLNDIELNDITQNNGLMNALRWVREVHHETIESTLIGPIILTIMLIGLITYLIGRRNG